MDTDNVEFSNQNISNALRNITGKNAVTVIKLIFNLKSQIEQNYFLTTIYKKKLFSKGHNTFFISRIDCQAIIFFKNFCVISAMRKWVTEMGHGQFAFIGFVNK